MATTVISVGPTPEESGRDISVWIKRATIDVAEDALLEEWKNGFDNEPVVITDGMPRRDYKLVKPFGTIEFAARADMAEIVRFALTELQKKSPVKTGRYASTHMVMINDQEVQGNIWAALRAVKETDRVQIVNPQPYARKIEGATANGKTGRGLRKPSSRQAPGGVYRPVQRAIINRFGRSLFVDYKNIKLSLGVKVWGDQGGRYRKVGKGRSAKSVRVGSVKRVQRDQVYPALQFFIKPTGIAN